MTVFTNVSPGPRVINVKAGVHPTSKAPIAKHHLLMPGESADLDVEDEKHPAFKGLLDSKQLVRGRPDTEQSAPEDLATLQATHEHLATELADVRRQADEARIAGTERIADLERQLAAKDEAHAAEIEQLRAEHEAQDAALTAPAEDTGKKSK